MPNSRLCPWCPGTVTLGSGLAFETSSPPDSCSGHVQALTLESPFQGRRRWLSGYSHSSIDQNSHGLHRMPGGLGGRCRGRDRSLQGKLAMESSHMDEAWIWLRDLGTLNNVNDSKHVLVWIHMYVQPHTWKRKRKNKPRLAIVSSTDFSSNVTSTMKSWILPGPLSLSGFSNQIGALKTCHKIPRSSLGHIKDYYLI